jgi:hypothetical protein
MQVWSLQAHQAGNCPLTHFMYLACCAPPMVTVLVPSRFIPNWTIPIVASAHKIGSPK